MATKVAQKIMIKYSQFIIQLTGVFPIKTSRKLPPPIAVTDAKIKTPNGSNFLRIAANAPEMAKTAVPI